MRCPISIIVVDDHPIVREGIVSNLNQQQDINVLAEGGDGIEAVSLVGKYLPNIVLLDLRMPYMDGLQAAAEINRSNLPTKVIIMTTFEDQEYIRRGMEAGVRSYLLKDCSRQIMLEAIRHVFEGGIYFLPQIMQKVVDRIQRPQLSRRELQVLGSIASGKSNKEIGGQLLISEGTVKTHVANVLEKLGVNGRTSAVKEGARLGLISMA